MYIQGAAGHGIRVAASRPAAPSDPAGGKRAAGPAHNLLSPLSERLDCHGHEKPDVTSARP